MNKYMRDCPYSKIDVYRVLEIFEVTNPAIQHAVKKLLCTGIRGGKDFDQDLAESIQALVRLQEMRAETLGTEGEKVRSGLPDGWIRTPPPASLLPGTYAEPSETPVYDGPAFVPGYNAKKVDERHRAERRSHQKHPETPAYTSVARVGEGWRWRTKFAGEPIAFKGGFETREEATKALLEYLGMKKTPPAPEPTVEHEPEERVTGCLADVAAAFEPSLAPVPHLPMGTDRRIEFGDRTVVAQGRATARQYIHPGWGWGAIDDAGLVTHLLCNGSGKLRDGDRCQPCRPCKGEGVQRAQLREAVLNPIHPR